MSRKVEKTNKSVLLHNPLDSDIRRPNGKLKAPKKPKFSGDDDMNMDEDEEDKTLTKSMKNKIFNEARAQREEMNFSNDDEMVDEEITYEYNEEADSGDENFDDDDEGEQLVNVDGDFVDGVGLSAAEEDVVAKFLNINRSASRSLADIIMDKIKQKEENTSDNNFDDSASAAGYKELPPKVVEVYTSVGKLLSHYSSGKLPKALKMLPHLKNWEEVLWITRPDGWSPIATYACTRIFASNLSAKMAQRFFNIVLLEKVRDDIRTNNKLNYHLYMALKKSLYKPAAFYKGLLLPLAMSKTCTLREATIIGSVISKVSVPSNHSAAVLLKLAEMPYFGSTSFFIKVFINKRYALPRRVVDALYEHFIQFENESRDLPVIWHQSLLAFVQRYKFELSPAQKDRMKLLLKAQVHHQITPEVRRELFVVAPVSHASRQSNTAALSKISDDVEMMH